VNRTALSARKQQILSAIIDSYISTGEPVGSKTLINQAELGVSSATVRNEMADLTNQGYLIQPHTSAGRIPTNLGYRYYIDNVMKVTPVSEQGREYIADKLYENADSPESILETATKLLSELTDCASFATTPNGDDSRVHKISFVQTGSHTAMVVLIASNGIIKTKLFRCEFIITPEILTIFDRALNELCAGVRLSSINQPFIQTAAARFGELSLFMPNVLSAIKDTSEKARQVSVCKSGITKLLFMSDANFPAVQRLIEYLNNDHDLSKMLEKLPIEPTVSIGHENNRVELSASSVISSRYVVDNNPSGVLAVVGPVRMNYSRVISIVDCISECAGEIISDLIEINNI
jgi:heat-inducible transcriptional repressor